MKLSDPIQYKAWDSQFFGYKVGALLYAGQHEVSVVQLLDCIKKSDFELIYFSCENFSASDRKLLENRATFYESKVYLKKEIHQLLDGNDALDGMQLISMIGQAADDHLLSLAYQSGLFSRFKLDKGFSGNEFEKLYKEWITKSVAGEMADEVFVLADKQAEYKGFVTVKLEDDFAEIGLIAVNEKHRGQNIGSSLLRAVEKYALEKGKRHVQVATQEINSTALNFYLKNGFKLVKKLELFHIRP